MNRLKWVALTVLGILVASSYPVCAENLSDQLAQLQSTDWHARQRAFKKLVREPEASPQGENKVRYAMFDLLTKENAYLGESHSDPDAKDGELIDFLNADQKDPASREQGYSAYYAELINWLGHYQDPHALDSLIGSLKRGGRDTTEAIVIMGPAALEPLTQKVTTADLAEQDAICQVLIAMASPEYCQKYLDDAARPKLADALKAGILHFPPTGDAAERASLHQAFDQVTSAHWCVPS